MRTSLFDADDNLTDEGRDLAAESETRLLAIFEIYKERGFSLRDVGSILHGSVTTAEAITCIDWRAEVHAAAKAKLLERNKS